MEDGPEISEVQTQKPQRKLDQQAIDELIQADYKEDPQESEDSRIYLREVYQQLAKFVTGSKEGNFFSRVKREIIKPRPVTVHEISEFADRWQNFVGNNRVQQALGKHELNIAEERLSRMILETALRPRSSQSQDGQAEMKHLKNLIVAPFVVLNKYNPFNYHGEKDFGFRNIQKYLSQFPQEKTEELKNSTIPGLRELTEMTANASQVTVEDLIKFRLEVTKMALHYLQNGTLQEKLYIARDVSRDVHLRETRNQILQILESENTPLEVRIEFFTSKISEDRATDNDLVLDMLFDYLTRHKNPQLLNLLKFNEGRLIDQFINKKELSMQDISALSKVFEESEERIKSAIDFARKQKGLNPKFNLAHHERSTEGTLSKLIRLATNKEIPSLLAELSKCGYELTTYQSGMDLDLFDRLLKEKGTLLPFIQELHTKGGYVFSNIGDIDALEELVANKDNLISALSDIRKYDPDFRYFIIEDWNPYEQFISHIDTSSGFSYDELVAIRRDKGSMPKEFSDPLFDALRAKLLSSKDASLSKNYLDLKKSEVPPETKAAFGKAINTVLEYVQKDPDIEWFYQDDTFLGVLTIRPEEAEAMASLPARFPELISLMEEGGPLYTNRENVLDSIFAVEDFDKQAQEIVTVFTKKQPYWDMLYFYTIQRLGAALAHAETSYPVKEPSSGRRRPFNSLNEPEKQQAFKEYLKIVIESSRSEIAKRQADQKNRKFLEQRLTLAEGDYIHGTAIDYMSEILLNGNLCGEALGQYASADTKPFQVDLGRVVAGKSKATSDILKGSISAGYGIYGKNGQDGQMFLILKRERANYEKGVDYQVAPNYALLFVGVPSTAIDAIVLRNPSVALESIKHEIAENGFYLPVYDLNGNLVFTTQDYDEFRKNENIVNTRIEIWDYSLKSGGQKGSNPAAEFTIPEEGGPTKYYVKFKTLENEGQIWNELLADSIYRRVGIAVPATKVVKVNGVYGHASKLIPDIKEGTAQSQDWKRGYLVDCLMSNWDILSALEQNTVTSTQTNEVFRVDSGGALLYRARGERKTVNDFGETVNELNEESPASPEKMGISEDQLITQAQLLKERLADDVIDSLVDSVRLVTQDRDYLKRVLKKRRDYITAKFLT